MRQRTVIAIGLVGAAAITFAWVVLHEQPQVSPAAQLAQGDGSAGDVERGNGLSLSRLGSNPERQMNSGSDERAETGNRLVATHTPDEEHHIGESSNGAPQPAQILDASADRPVVVEQSTAALLPEEIVTLFEASDTCELYRRSRGVPNACEEFRDRAIRIVQTNPDPEDSWSAGIESELNTHLDRVLAKEISEGKVRRRYIKCVQQGCIVYIESTHWRNSKLGAPLIRSLRADPLTKTLIGSRKWPGDYWEHQPAIRGATIVVFDPP